MQKNKMFVGSRARPVRKADNLTGPSMCRHLDNVGSSISHNPTGHGLEISLVNHNICVHVVLTIL
jgi:hypothetical protein